MLPTGEDLALFGDPTRLAEAPPAPPPVWAPVGGWVRSSPAWCSGTLPGGGTARGQLTAATDSRPGLPSPVPHRPLVDLIGVPGVARGQLPSPQDAVPESWSRAPAQESPPWRPCLSLCPHQTHVFPCAVLQRINRVPQKLTRDSALVHLEGDLGPPVRGGKWA